jgi:hypothetical protein
MMLAAFSNCQADIVSTTTNMVKIKFKIVKRESNGKQASMLREEHMAVHPV